MDTSGTKEYNFKQPVNGEENDFKDQVKKKGRRSSVFRRRSLHHNLTNSLEEDTTTQATNGISSSYDLKQIEDYMETLESEKRDWLSAYKNLKRKFKSLNSLSDENTELLDQKSCSQYLTSEDKQLLANQPDYRGISKLFETTSETVVFRIKKIDHFKQLINNFSVIVEEKIKDFINECITKLEEDCLKYKLDEEDFYASDELDVSNLNAISIESGTE